MARAPAATVRAIDPDDFPSHQNTTFSSPPVADNRANALESVRPSMRYDQHLSQGPRDCHLPKTAALLFDATPSVNTARVVEKHSMRNSHPSPRASVRTSVTSNTGPLVRFVACALTNENAASGSMFEKLLLKAGDLMKYHHAKGPSWAPISGNLGCELTTAR